MVSERKLEKTAMRQRGRELRAILNEWDPIGVMGPDAKPGDDEYDDLLWPVMRLLEGGASAGDLARYLVKKLDEDYGLNVGESKLQGVSSSIKEWFERNWPNSRA